MGCCCGSGNSFNSFRSGIPSSSAQFTVGGQTRFFPSDPCCQLKAQRFLLDADPCCKLRHSVPQIPIVSNNGIIFI